MSRVPNVQIGAVVGSRDSPILVQVFLDFSCPYSRKMFTVLFKEVIPVFRHRVAFVLHNQVQPWHFQSTFLHEAFLAVNKISPDRAWPFAHVLFEHQESVFGDEKMFNKSRGDIYKEIMKLVRTDPAINVAQIEQQLTPVPEKNNENPIIMEFKQGVKYTRTLGVHVSPTVLINGLIDDSISSSWTFAQWNEYLLRFPALADMVKPQ